MVEEINIKKGATCPGLIKSNESPSPNLAEEDSQHGHGVQKTGTSSIQQSPVLLEDSYVVHQVSTVDWHDPLCSQKTETKQKFD